ncbi:CBO0543 family protein [Aquibacillus sediminis]|uniref:CBO0543 family protein n=1 Tax=Aquibacillus sediminis TaxID=2574734 RepID=UPI001107EFA6|nr:CBO0543 family protein [Aquibacillus sediminis]
MNVNEKFSEGVKEVYTLLKQSTDLHKELWIEHVVFSWRWWLVLVLTILPWIFWSIFRKKGSTHRLLFVGFFTMFISILLDITGARLGWWYYKYEVIPFSPSFKPWDISLLPVLTMFFLQVRPQINFFIKAVIYAFLIAFCAEPLFMWLGFYEYPNWEYIYSFIIYFIIYLFSHYIVTRNEFDKIK